MSDFDRYGEQVLMESQSPIISLAFSPQGDRLAYVSYEEDLARIFIQDLRTGQRKIVAAFSGVNSAPSWSPDGKKLAMALSFSGTTKLYIMDLATQALQKITSGTAIDTEPFWRKDGKGIVFTSNRSGAPQIYEYQFGSAHVRQLTNYGDYNVAPQMSRDGRKLVYLSRIDYRLQVVLEDLEQHTRQYLGDGNFDDTPRIAPNDALVMYTTAAKSGVGSMLTLVSIDGAVRMPMVASEASLKHPSWSPVPQVKVAD